MPHKPRPRILRADEPCEECESMNGAERHNVTQQAIYAMERYKPIVRAYEMCGACGTFLDIDTLGGGFIVKGTEHEWEWWDYADWYHAGFPPLHPSRSTRVPIKPRPTLFGPSEPTADAPIHYREVPHDWRYV